MCFASSQQDGDKAPFSICKCVNLRVAPSARTANSLLLLPLPPAAERCAFTCVESIICVSVDRPFPATPGTDFPNAAPRPTHKAVIDRCWRAIFGRAIAPTAAALQHMYYAADNTAIMSPINAPDIRRQVDLRSVAIARRLAKTGFCARSRSPFQNRIQDRIVDAEKLMSSDPSSGHIAEDPHMRGNDRVIDHHRRTAVRQVGA